MNVVFRSWGQFYAERLCIVTVINNNVAVMAFKINFYNFVI